MRLEKLERDEQVKAKDELLHQARMEKEQLEVRLREFSEHSSSLQQNMLKAKDKEQEYMVIINELERVRESQRQLTLERERLSSEVKKKDITLSQGNKQIEVIMRQKEELMKENKTLRTQVHELKSVSNEDKNTSIKLNEKINSYEVAMQDLKDMYTREQAKHQEAMSVITQLKSENQSLGDKNQDLGAKITQLKSLSEGLERSREELIQRL